MTVTVQTNSLPSPNGGKGNSFFAGLGAKISRALSGDSPSSPTMDDDARSTTSTKIDQAERSLSRGREGFHSSGRGGLGNIRAASASRDRPTDGPDDFSVTRGREPAVDPSRQVYSTGRGGAGNIRSPSRDPQTTSSAISDAQEAKILRDHAEAEKTAIHSSGRGGLGNISRSRSRGPSSQAVSPPRHSTGRGGAGNIFSGAGKDIVEEEERRQHAHSEGIHSTGRGGYANMTSTPGPGIEHHGHVTGEFESSGRGGAGNIREHSGSRDPQHHEKHGISGLFHHKHDHQADVEAARPEPHVSETGVDGGGMRGGVL